MSQEVLISVLFAPRIAPPKDEPQKIEVASSVLECRVGQPPAELIEGIQEATSGLIRRARLRLVADHEGDWDVLAFTHTKL